MSVAGTAAEQIVGRLRITDPRDLRVEDIAWECGALVREEPLDGAVARLARFGNRAVITVSSRLPQRGRKRFAISHELGHLTLHSGQSDLNLCLESDLAPTVRRLRRNAADENPEADANAFSSTLLMPSALFGPRCERQKPSLALVESLADVFDTTLTATAIRYMAFCGEACAVVWSEKRRIKWYWASRDFDFHVKVHEEIDAYSIAYDWFEGKTPSKRPTSVDASSWLAPGRYKEDALVQEDSRGLPNYDAVLTLLWIDRDIEKEWEPQEKFTPDGRYGRRR